MKLCVLCYVLPTRQGNTSISGGWSTLAASSGMEASTSNPPNHVGTTSPYLEYLFPEYCTKTHAAAAATACTRTTTSTHTNTNTNTNKESLMTKGSFQLYLGTTHVRPVTALVRRLPALIESYQTVAQVQTAYQLQATALKRLSEKAALVVHSSKVNDKKKNSGRYKGKTKLHQSHRENNIFACSSTTGANQNPVASSGNTVAAMHAERVLPEVASGEASGVGEPSIQCPQQEQPEQPEQPEQQEQQQEQQEPQPQFAADQLSSATDVRSSDQNQAQQSKAQQISNINNNNNNNNNNNSNNNSSNKGGKQRRDHTETRSKELSLENQFWADLAKGVFDTDSEGDDAHKGHKTSRNDAQRNRDLREQHRAEFLKKRELLLKQQAQSQEQEKVQKKQQYHPEVCSSSCSNNNNTDTGRVVGQKSKSSDETLQQQQSAQESGDGAVPKAPRLVGPGASGFPFASLPAFFAARTVEPAKVAASASAATATTATTAATTAATKASAAATTTKASAAASKEVKRPEGPRPLVSIASTVTTKLQLEGATSPRTGSAGSAGACTGAGAGADTVTGFAAALSSHAQQDNADKNSCIIQ
jgi:hypothetical protein